MSLIVKTDVGRFRSVTDGKRKWWLWECPSCKTWGNLSLDQWEGKVSVVCTAPKQFWYPPKIAPCSTHMTNNFAQVLVTKMQGRALLGLSPYEPEDKAEAA